MIYLGIDPGASGAISVFDDLNLITVFDVPMAKVDGEKVFDLHQANKLINEAVGSRVIEAIYIEKVGARHGQGVKSMFSFGERFAETKLLALSYTDNIKFITPQKWKGAAGLIGTDKKESAVRAAKIYPNCKELYLEPNNRCKDGVKCYDGRGDSTMIGLIGYKLFGG